MRSRDELRGAIIGTLLGDSWLQMRTKGTATWGCEQTSKPLIQLKAQIANELTGRTHRIVSRKRPPRKILENPVESNPKTTFSIHVTHPRLKNYYKILYRDSIKTPTMRTLRWLTDEGVALWFMDDGMKNISGDHNRIIFCTDSFDRFSLSQICQFFSERYGLSSTITSRGRIQLSGKDAQRLILIMSPFLLPEFRYKTLLGYGDFSRNSKRVLPEFKKYLEHYREDIV